MKLNNVISSTSVVYSGIRSVDTTETVCTPIDADITGQILDEIELLKQNVGRTWAFSYSQPSETLNITINHGLGFRPNISVFEYDTAERHEPLINHIDNNNTQIIFLIPTKFNAYFS